MDQRHQEYIEYYKARMKKYENNPMYRNSYESENAMYEAIKSCALLEEFKQKAEEGRLPFKNALAIMKDQETAREKFYLSIKEPIRAKASSEILKMLKTTTDLNDMMTRANEIRQKNMVEISMDELSSEFYSAFTYLENMEVWEKADVPSRWKDEIRKNIESTIEDSRKVYHEVSVPSALNWDPHYKFNIDLIWEDRHRRDIPMPDETVKRRIAQFKKIIE